MSARLEVSALSGLIGAIMKLVIEALFLFNLGGPSLIIKQQFGVNRAPLKIAAKSKIN